MSQMIETQPQPQWIYSLWKFSRPHTIIGTSLSVFGVFLIALKFAPELTDNWDTLGLGSPIFPAFFAWFACICGNIYIVGLNQLEDIDIDKINKPHLPLASGEFSTQTGRIIVAIAGILALVISATQGIYLFAMVGISLTIGTMYSLPPVRLKRFPFLAALCIFSVRGAIVNLGLFLHFRHILATTNIPPFTIPGVVWILTGFVLVFTIAIAIFKDIPDLEGDKLYNINTFTVKLGKRAVFNLSLAIITICYLTIIGIALLNITQINQPLAIASHSFLLGLTWWRSDRVNLNEKTQITSFYQFIWKLFFLEYLLFPLACLLS